MNTRAKGARTQLKAFRYAASFPETWIIPLYQPPRFAKPQPFDMILLRHEWWPCFVEIRTNQWGVAKPQTRALTQLPGTCFRRQIWRFPRGATVPDIRQWNGTEWVSQEDPWEGE